MTKTDLCDSEHDCSSPPKSVPTSPGASWGIRTHNCQINNQHDPNSMRLVLLEKKGGVREFHRLCRWQHGELLARRGWDYVAALGTWSDDYSFEDDYLRQLGVTPPGTTPAASALSDVPCKVCRNKVSPTDARCWWCEAPGPGK